LALRYVIKCIGITRNISRNGRCYKPVQAIYAGILINNIDWQPSDDREIAVHELA